MLGKRLRELGQEESFKVLLGACEGEAAKKTLDDACAPVTKENSPQRAEVHHAPLDYLQARDKRYPESFVSHACYLCENGRYAEVVANLKPILYQEVTEDGQLDGQNP